MFTSIITLFFIGLLGTPHCTAMCGGISCIASSNDKKKYALYHLSRGGSYILLGTIAGLFGNYIENLAKTYNLKGLPYLILGLLGIFYIFKLLKNKSYPVSSLVQINNAQLNTVKNKKSPLFSILIGFLTGFIPCSLLHIQLLTATATRSPLIGGLFMAAFFLGTLPGFYTFRIIINKILSPVLKFPKPYLVSILIFASTLCFWQFFDKTNQRNSHKMSCH